MNIETDRILAKALSGERISDDEALALFRCSDLAALGAAADAIRRRRHPDPVVTYIVDRNVNYTNVCITDCKFCAFYRRPGDQESYTLTYDQIGAKVQATIDRGGVQILMQGGHHPHLKLDWYEGLLRHLKANYRIHIHGFSAPEIQHFSLINKLPVGEVIRRLRAAGLDTIPGGGAEILTDRVRGIVNPKKATADEWIGIHEEAHRQGMKTTCTMMYGHVETTADRIEHLRRLRDLQDRTGGFTAFICWSFQAPNTEMADVPMAGSFDYLRTLAVSRIYLDNLPNLQSSWVTQGPKIGQLALRFGANDMGSVMMEENVVSAAGTTFRLPEEEMRRLIEDLGYAPRRRDCFYRVIEGTEADPPRKPEFAVA